MDPLQRGMESVNRTGQGLIQSAAMGVNTTALEEDLEALNEKWAQANEKVSIY